ncbi:MULTISPECIES: hypothetical protein [unclassified Sphingomonas]|nr:hypothetical protein [Sphingomonas sp. SORGH_AS_0879]MDQ1230201.1 hypothetical protein [Sphingomonas sp. SORGH_AS_0879]
MLEFLEREQLAYLIIGAVLLSVVAFAIPYMRRRKREKLRRRGIKKYGH